MDGIGWVLLILAMLVVGAWLMWGLPRNRGEQPSEASPELLRHVQLANEAVAAFDGTEDAAVKMKYLPIIERETAAILAFEPDNESALAVMAKLPKLQAALAEDAESSSASEEGWQSVDFDTMRAGLQKVSYGMVGKHVSTEDKERFKRDMTEFASVDPLVKGIVERVRVVIDGSPGIMQSKIYKHFPDYDVEKVRYALYFAHELGLIYRRKKGNSYQLFPPGNVVDGEVLKS